MWHAQDGWQQGNQDHIASITISPPVQPPVGKAHLTLEVYCPPYKAPSHGSVWYKGVEYRDSTSPGAIEGKRKTWRVGGKDLPIARSGDIRSVRIRSFAFQNLTKGTFVANFMFFLLRIRWMHNCGLAACFSNDFRATCLAPQIRRRKEQFYHLMFPDFVILLLVFSHLNSRFGTAL